MTLKQSINLLLLMLMFLVMHAAWAVETNKTEISGQNAEKKAASHLDVNDRTLEFHNPESHTLTPCKGKRPLVVTLLPSVDSHYIASIQVSLVGQSAYQTFDSMMDDRPYRGMDYFRILDIDHDNCQDIAVLRMFGATGNVLWSFWRYDSKMERFEYEPQLSKLFTPTFLPDGTISTHERLGGGEWVSAKYRFQEKQLKKMSEIRREYDRKMTPEEGDGILFKCTETIFSGTTETKRSVSCE